MPSSSRTAQLALWREIVLNRESIKPVNQHLDFIRKRFDKLDSEGFIWSKESVLDIFLQLGLSESPHDSFSSASEVVGSRLQGFKSLSGGRKEVIEIQKSEHTFRPLGLMDLPIEVFDNILKNLDGIAKLEAAEIYKEKRRAMPTVAMATPIDLWTEDILLKHGTYVRSLSLTLSANCTKPADCENDEDQYMEPISPESVRALIKRCPNVSELGIKCDYEAGYRDTGGTETFLLELIPLLSSLKQLRHLTLDDGQKITVRNGHEYFKLRIVNGLTSEIVASLPLLESFNCQAITASGDQQKLGNSSFGFNLSQLKSLSHLTLWDIKDVDVTWCLFDWPRTITKLVIQECVNLSLSSAHRLINHITPCLTMLTLEFTPKYRDDIAEIDYTWEVDPTWDPHSRFCLPSLTDLKFSTSNGDLVTSFQDCKSL
ncbi:uncharacterized protein MELLADRAFT_69086 [Melampsora larici-populina 98AG31]|uniref:F-box domain-containing protein n=1 Tax=Melampsora larici-populina (strain 98AG31 / pathotype 3-4-7) TaxID=747676 RepID=F4S9C1_MELLP|nr:uncharacterized protein MELLADRAFT_69086 [Melampsora larici-populina 98AG31]EGF98699.1 hypothetical protein MELLADRAFT_69086 [Melampsora larici-populina 98AG31]